MKHEIYMQRCLYLARLGIPKAFPNPLVGCVIVHKDKIIGEGYHQEFGKSHAEINAIAAVKDKSLLKESTLYVNLEPCSHYGKTPPCTKSIIEMQIPEVVIGSIDCNKDVCGRGIHQLKETGIKVVSGILDKENRELNKRFYCFHEKQRPYIILKWAESKDGFIDIDRSKITYDREKHWISSKAAQQLVHQWRAEEMGILIGGKTANNDNPQLNTRLVKGKNPLRIILCTQEDLDEKLAIFQDGIPSLIFCAEEKHSNYKHLQFINIPTKEDSISFVLDELHKRGINSVIVEGGKKILESFIANEKWDEARIIQGNIIFGNGVTAPSIRGLNRISKKIEQDTYTLLYNNTNN
jgi:diaminohydroxyphosphoribosylaminopyrimidine deaminase / 5-amino-6-(5-phosphoribosylamino)uracil reductase